jgi:hypothetical protein
MAKQRPKNVLPSMSSVVTPKMPSRVLTETNILAKKAVSGRGKKNKDHGEYINVFIPLRFVLPCRPNQRKDEDLSTETWKEFGVAA